MRLLPVLCVRPVESKSCTATSSVLGSSMSYLTLRTSFRPSRLALHAPSWTRFRHGPATWRPGLGQALRPGREPLGGQAGAAAPQLETGLDTLQPPPAPDPPRRLGTRDE